MADEIEFDNEIYKVLLDKFHDELSNDLKGYYTWDFNEETLNEFKVSSACKKSIPHKDKKDDNYRAIIPEKTIIIKRILKEELKKDLSYLDFATWIVNKWGNIKQFNAYTDKNKKKLIQLRENVIQRNNDDYIDFIEWEGISSYSKVASFLNENKFAVYDSRVAFTLNWLIFTNKLHQADGGNMKFFRQPDGRNSDIERHNQESIFNLVYKGKFNIDDFYYKPKETYKMYCRLLKKTCDFCNSQSKSPLKNVTIGKLEMSLFSIAANDEKNTMSNVYKERKKFITNEMDYHLKIERI